MAGNSNVVNANPTLPPRRANSTEVVGKWTQIVRLPVTQPQEKSYEHPPSNNGSSRSKNEDIKKNLNPFDMKFIGKNTQDKSFEHPEIHISRSKSRTDDIKKNLNPFDMKFLGKNKINRQGKISPNSPVRQDNVDQDIGQKFTILKGKHLLYS